MPKLRKNQKDNTYMKRMLQKPKLTKEEREKEAFNQQARAKVMLATVQKSLYAMDKFSMSPLYKHKIAAAGNLFISAVESMTTSMLQGNVRTGFNVDPNATQQYSDEIEYLIVQIKIHDAIVSCGDEKKYEFFNDLEDLYIKHGLLKKKGELITKIED